MPFKGRSHCAQVLLNNTPWRAQAFDGLYLYVLYMQYISPTAKRRLNCHIKKKDRSRCCRNALPALLESGANASEQQDNSAQNTSHQSHFIPSELETSSVSSFEDSSPFCVPNAQLRAWFFPHCNGPFTPHGAAHPPRSSWLSRVRCPVVDSGRGARHREGPLRGALHGLPPQTGGKPRPKSPKMRGFSSSSEEVGGFGGMSWGSM